MRKAILAGAVMSVLLPVLAFAQTNDTQAQIQSLLNQIHALQEQLKALLASAAASGTRPDLMQKPMQKPNQPPGQLMKIACIELNRNLGIGSQGEDVRKLQEMLANDPANEFHVTPTGFFGPITARAMVKFQIRNGIASSTTGVVGPATRAFFERACGRGLKEMLLEQKDAMMRGAVVGEITENTGTSIVLKSRDGTTRVVNVLPSTTIQILGPSGLQNGMIADLTVGLFASAEGTLTNNGSINATHIKAGKFSEQKVPEKPQSLVPGLESYRALGN